MNLSSDRIFGLVLLALAVAVGIGAWQMVVPISYDPLGPRAFPMGLALMLALMWLVMIVRPAPGESMPDRTTLLRLAGVIVVLSVYAFMFTKAGYVASSVVALAVLARLFGASWWKAIVAGGVVALGSYALFGFALGIALPVGTWFIA